MSYLWNTRCILLCIILTMTLVFPAQSQPSINTQDKAWVFYNILRLRQ